MVISGTGVTQRIELGWRALLSAIEGIPEEQLLAPGAVGDWSIKDLLGHLAHWNHVATARIMAVATGQPDLADSCDDHLVVNARETARRSDWPLEQVWAEFHESHASVLAALQQAHEAGVAVNPELFAGCTYGHYDEHAADIRAYRERLGSA